MHPPCRTHWNESREGLTLDLSADGRTVLFNSNATNLDPADPDTVEDVYVKYEQRRHRACLNL